MPLSRKIAFRLIKWRRLHNTESQGSVNTFWLLNAGFLDFLHCSLTYCSAGSFFKLNILVKLLFERPPLKSLRERGVGRLFHNAVNSIRVGQKLLDSCLKTSTMSEDNFAPNLSTCQFKIRPGVCVPSREWTREWEGERERVNRSKIYNQNFPVHTLGTQPIKGSLTVHHQYLPHPPQLNCHSCNFPQYKLG